MYYCAVSNDGFMVNIFHNAVSEAGASDGRSFFTDLEEDILLYAVLSNTVVWIFVNNIHCAVSCA